jgi:hypothetical protein
VRVDAGHLARFASGCLCASCGLIADLGNPRALARPEGGADVVFPGDAAASDAIDTCTDGNTPVDSADDSADDAAGAAVDAAQPADSGVGDLRALSIALGARHACAIIRTAADSPLNGTVRCWGSNESGELGSLGPSTSTPQVVASASGGPFGNATALALGNASSCVITEDAFLFCWGALTGLNPAGVDRVPGAGPYAPAEMLWAGNSTAFASASIGDGGCALMLGGLLCWGSSYVRKTQAEGGVGAFYRTYSLGAASVGGAHACALTTDGTNDVACWGDNTYGQAGARWSNVIAMPQPLGLPAVAGSAAVEIGAGGGFSCARLANLSVYCWGQNDRGQLGNGTGISSGIPTAVQFAPGPKAKQIALGDNHACARMEDNSVQCWGDNTNSQLAQGVATAFSSVPVTVQKAPGMFLPFVESVAAGGDTTCVTRLPSSRMPLSCWGDNTYGQAGQPPLGTPVVPYATPMSL